MSRNSRPRRPSPPIRRVFGGSPSPPPPFEPGCGLPPPPSSTPPPYSHSLQYSFGSSSTVQEWFTDEQLLRGSLHRDASASGSLSESRKSSPSARILRRPAPVGLKPETGCSLEEDREAEDSSLKTQRSIPLMTPAAKHSTAAKQSHFSFEEEMEDEKLWVKSPSAKSEDITATHSSALFGLPSTDKLPPAPVLPSSKLRVKHRSHSEGSGQLYAAKRVQKQKAEELDKQFMDVSIKVKMTDANLRSEVGSVKKQVAEFLLRMKTRVVILEQRHNDLQQLCHSLEEGIGQLQREASAPPNLKMASASVLSPPSIMAEMSVKSCEFSEGTALGQRKVAGFFEDTAFELASATASQRSEKPTRGRVTHTRVDTSGSVERLQDSESWPSSSESLSLSSESEESSDALLSSIASEYSEHLSSEENSYESDSGESIPKRKEEIVAFDELRATKSLTRVTLSTERSSASDRLKRKRSGKRHMRNLSDSINCSQQLALFLMQKQKGIDSVIDSQSDDATFDGAKDKSALAFDRKKTVSKDVIELSDSVSDDSEIIERMRSKELIVSDVIGTDVVDDEIIERMKTKSIALEFDFEADVTEESTEQMAAESSASKEKSSTPGDCDTSASGSLRIRRSLSRRQMQKQTMASAKTETQPIEEKEKSEELKMETKSESKMADAALDSEMSPLSAPTSVRPQTGDESETTEVLLTLPSYIVPKLAMASLHSADSQKLEIVDENGNAAKMKKGGRLLPEPEWFGQGAIDGVEEVDDNHLLVIDEKDEVEKSDDEIAAEIAADLAALDTAADSGGHKRSKSGKKKRRRKKKKKSSSGSVLSEETLEALANDSLRLARRRSAKRKRRMQSIDLSADDILRQNSARSIQRRGTVSLPTPNTTKGGSFDIADCFSVVDTIVFEKHAIGSGLSAAPRYSPKVFENAMHFMRVHLKDKSQALLQVTVCKGLDLWCKGYRAWMRPKKKRKRKSAKGSESIDGSVDALERCNLHVIFDSGTDKEQVIQEMSLLLQNDASYHLAVLDSKMSDAFEEHSFLSCAMQTDLKSTDDSVDTVLRRRNAPKSMFGFVVFEMVTGVPPHKVPAADSGECDGLRQTRAEAVAAKLASARPKVADSFDLVLGFVTNAKGKADALCMFQPSAHDFEAYSRVLQSEANVFELMKQKCQLQHCGFTAACSCRVAHDSELKQAVLHFDVQSSV